MHFRTLSAALLLGSLLSAHGARAELVNGGAERIAVGGVPEGWRFSTEQTGYSVVSVSDGAYEGRTCIRIARSAEGDASAFGSVAQVLSADKYRGKRVLFRAALRTEGESEARLFVREDLQGGRTGFFEDMGRHPVRSGSWRHYQIEADIGLRAVRLTVGCLARGSGAVYLDDATLVIAGEAPVPVEAEPPRALTAEGLENLVAFARLYGVVRYFHPSDEAESADWDRIAVGGSAAVESAGGPEQLARVLQEIFQPVAPSLRVFPSGLQARLPEPPSGTRSRVWRHLGLGHGSGAIFQSSRVDLESAKSPEAYPDPARPWRVDLPGGVTCRVPLAVPADESGTLPKATVLLQWALPADKLPVGADRTSRLGAVVVAWNVLQHFYPYFDRASSDWGAELRSALRQAAVDEGERSFLDTLRRLTAALGDASARVAHPSEKAHLFLPVTCAWVGDDLVVESVPSGVQLSPGDVIQAIDGRPVAELVGERGALISAATPGWLRWRLRFELMQLGAPERRRVQVRAWNRGDELQEVSLTPLDPAVGLSGPLRPEPIAELVPGIWYVDASRFDVAAFRAALPQLEASRGLVLDFRRFAGSIDAEALFSHLAREVLTGPQHHVPIIRWPDRRRIEFFRSQEWEFPPASPHLAAPKIFLTGPGSVGITETCLGVAEGHRLGRFVGGPTAGTSGDVNTVVLPGGYELSWTGAVVRKHDETPHHGVGIVPDVPVAATREGLAAGRDEVLVRAVELLGG